MTHFLSFHSMKHLQSFGCSAAILVQIMNNALTKSTSPSAMFNTSITSLTIPAATFDTSYPCLHTAIYSLPVGPPSYRFLNTFRASRTVATAEVTRNAMLNKMNLPRPFRPSLGVSRNTESPYITMKSSTPTSSTRQPIEVHKPRAAGHTKLYKRKARPSKMASCSGASIEIDVLLGRRIGRHSFELDGRGTQGDEADRLLVASFIISDRYVPQERQGSLTTGIRGDCRS
jgi:hypothetical protein